MKPAGLACLAALFAAASAGAQMEVASLAPVADATLYESDGTNEFANGSGQQIFCGRTGGNLARRALLRFDPSNVIPAGSVVNNATLTLWLTNTPVGAQTVSLHRLEAVWSEGPTAPGGGEGQGAPATTGDATWFYSTLPSIPWAEVGGTFVAEASASCAVDQLGPYVWESAELTADVQAWVNGSTNNGWLILGKESTFPTAKRFASREHLEPSLRPVLVVEFTPPGCAGDWDHDGDTDSDDVVQFFGAWETGEGDVDGDSDSDSDDIVTFFASWDSGC